MERIKLQNNDVKIKQQEENNNFLNLSFHIAPKLDQIKKMVNRLKGNIYQQQQKTQQPHLQKQKYYSLSKKIQQQSKNLKQHHRSMNLNTQDEQQILQKYNKNKESSRQAQIFNKLSNKIKRSTTLDAEEKIEQQKRAKIIRIRIKPERKNERNSKHKFKSSNLSLNKIQISQKQYNTHLKTLQDLYDSLASLLIDIKKINQIVFEKIAIYINQIKSQQNNFMLEFIEQIPFKYHKQIIISRLYQYFSVIALTVQLIFDTRDKQCHLINFIGHATSNLIFLSKLYMLTHKKINGNMSNYELSINQFLKQSFNQNFTTIDEIVLKIQLNNETMSILANKLNSKILIYYKFKEYIKNIDHKVISIQHSIYFMFEYLSYFLHQNQLTGKFSIVDIPLTPFIKQNNLKEYTTIIQPYSVLMFIKKQKLCIRLNTHSFLSKISKYSNIIFWTAFMPEEIDNLLPYISFNIEIERILYKYHTNTQNGQSIKDIRKIGRNLRKTVIIDTNTNILTPDNSIELSWTGAKNDSKLSYLENILIDIFEKKYYIQQALEIYEQQLKKCSKKQKNRLKTYQTLST